jgi:hypothetical protein
MGSCPVPDCLSFALPVIGFVVAALIGFTLDELLLDEHYVFVFLLPVVYVGISVHGSN